MDVPHVKSRTRKLQSNWLCSPHHPPPNPRWTAQRGPSYPAQSGLGGFSLMVSLASLHLPGERSSVTEDPIRMTPQTKAVALPNPSRSCQSTPMAPEDTDPASWGWATPIFLHPHGLVPTDHRCFVSHPLQSRLHPVMLFCSQSQSVSLEIHFKLGATERWAAASIRWWREQLYLTTKRAPAPTGTRDSAPWPRPRISERFRGSFR